MAIPKQTQRKDLRPGTHIIYIFSLKGRLITHGTYKECAARIGVHHNTVRSALLSHAIVHKRFIVSETPEFNPDAAVHSQIIRYSNMHDLYAFDLKGKTITKDATLDQVMKEFKCSRQQVFRSVREGTVANRKYYFSLVPFKKFAAKFKIEWGRERQRGLHAYTS